MDKAFYEAEIDALQKQLIETQQVAIERGFSIIKAHEEIRRLNADIRSLRESPMTVRQGERVYSWPCGPTAPTELGEFMAAERRTAEVAKSSNGRQGQ